MRPSPGFARAYYGPSAARTQDGNLREAKGVRPAHSGGLPIHRFGSPPGNWVRFAHLSRVPNPPGSAGDWVRFPKRGIEARLHVRPSQGPALPVGRAELGLFGAIAPACGMGFCPPGNADLSIGVRAGIGFVCTTPRAPPGPGGKLGSFCATSARRLGLFPETGHRGDVAYSVCQGPDRPAKLASFRTSNFTPRTSDSFSIGFVSPQSRPCMIHHNSCPSRHLSLPVAPGKLGLFVQNPTSRVPRASSRPAPRGNWVCFARWATPAELALFC